jgi:hypothetical protein
MKSAIGKAGKRLFAQDDDAQLYAAADTLSEEYVAVSTEAEDTDNRTVRLRFNSLLHTLALCVSPNPYRLPRLTLTYSLTSLLVFQREIRQFCVP